MAERVPRKFFERLVRSYQPPTVKCLGSWNAILPKGQQNSLRAVCRSFVCGLSKTRPMVRQAAPSRRVSNLQLTFAQPESAGKIPPAALVGRRRSEIAQLCRKPVWRVRRIRRLRVPCGRSSWINQPCCRAHTIATMAMSTASHDDPKMLGVAPGPRNCLPGCFSDAIQ